MHPRSCCCRSQACSWEIQTELSQKPRTALSLPLKTGLMLALGAKVQGCVFMCLRVCPRAVCLCTVLCLRCVHPNTHILTVAFWVKGVSLVSRCVPVFHF